MSRKKPVPDVIRDGNRFSDKDMCKTGRIDPGSSLVAAPRQMRYRPRGAAPWHGLRSALAGGLHLRDRALGWSSGRRPRRDDIGQADAVVLGPDIAQPMADVAAQHE